MKWGLKGGFSIDTDSATWLGLIYYTGCASHFGNLTNFNILKEPLLVKKQTIHQQKALDLSFFWDPKSGRGIIKRLPRPLAVEQLFLPHAFRGERAWRPPDNATPTFRASNESWDPGLSVDVSFVSVLAMVLSEYWKRLEENFSKRLFLRFHKNNEISKKKFL